MGMLRDHFQEMRNHQCPNKNIVATEQTELASFKCNGCGKEWAFDEEQVGEMLMHFDQRDEVINHLLGSIEGKRQLIEMVNV